jgi:diaminopropionate ammonia-lyase
MFLQAGVGGMAAASCAQFWQAFGVGRPQTILVEPEQCACWYASLKSGAPTAVTGDIDSFMGGLACGDPSTLAWDILKEGADAAVTLNDNAARATMRILAEGVANDPPLVGGESGVAGLAGLITCARNVDARELLGLSASSRVIIFGTEGATDEEMYERVVGRSWQEVAGQAR